MSDPSTLGRISETLGGIPVWGCIEGSPAARAGIRHGDVILSVDGTPTPTLDAYIEARTRARERMTLIVFRDGAERSVVVELDEAEAMSLERVARQVVDERLVPTVAPPRRRSDA